MTIPTYKLLRCTLIDLPTYGRITQECTILAVILRFVSRAAAQDQLWVARGRGG